MRYRFNLILAVAATISSVCAAPDPPLASPDKRMEVYKETRNPDGTGCRLYLRPFGSKIAGTLVIQNDRWIDVKWSPSSRFLAVIDHPDGHVSDVYVYMFTRRVDDEGVPIQSKFCVIAENTGQIAQQLYFPGVSIKLCYHSPDPWAYDVKWDFVGWDRKNNTMILSKTTRDADTYTRVGTKIQVSLPSNSLSSSKQKEAEPDSGANRYGTSVPKLNSKPAGNTP